MKKYFQGIAVLALAASTGCGGSATLSNSAASQPEVPAECEGRMVTLETAQYLMSGCKVRMVGQPHQGPVLLHLLDKSKLCFFQPRLGWVLEYASTACPSAPVQMVTE